MRIFTLDREMPFAGHPTLGSCHAWLALGGAPSNETEIIQECGAGLVSIRREGGRLCFAAPPLIRSGAPSGETLADSLRFLGIASDEVLDAAWIDNGPGGWGSGWPAPSGYFPDAGEKLAAQSGHWRRRPTCRG
ncbi:PhzF family phenazine biosynthesis protein [Serratia ureilytica]